MLPRFSSIDIAAKERRCVHSRPGFETANYFVSRQSAKMRFVTDNSVKMIETRIVSNRIRKSTSSLDRVLECSTFKCQEFDEEFNEISCTCACKVYITVIRICMQVYVSSLRRTFFQTFPFIVSFIQVRPTYRHSILMNTPIKSLIRSGFDTRASDFLQMECKNGTA